MLSWTSLVLRYVGNWEIKPTDNQVDVVSVLDRLQCRARVAIS